jgi:hypothetical protein
LETRQDIHLIGVVLAANGHYALNMRDMMDIDIDSIGIPGPEEHPKQCGPWSREGEKDSVYPIGDGEKQKARILSKKKGPAMGLEPTWV